MVHGWFIPTETFVHDVPRLVGGFKLEHLIWTNDGYTMVEQSMAKGPKVTAVIHGG